ncbi:MAG: phage portal protein [Desulfovibrionaceae bacterium]
MARASLTRRPWRGRHARRESASLRGPLANWNNSIISRGETDRQLERSAERALDLYTNDAMAHGVLETMLVEAVGIGHTPQPSPKTSWLDLDVEWEDKFQDASRSAWETWGLDCRNWCDAMSRLNIYGLQGLAYFDWRLFGIGVTQVVSRADNLRPLSLALLPVSPFRLATPSDATNADIYDGIEVDADGNPLAVWFRKPTEYLGTATTANCTRVPYRDEATGLPRILLTTDVRNVCEYRQDSVLGPMLGEIRHSNDLAEAVVVGAMLRNLFTMFVQDYGAGAVDKNTPWNERIIETEKGTILAGGKNEKPIFFDHQAAPSGYGDLFSGIIDRLGMSTGRGAENILRRFQASYSASRANMEKADQFNEREHMVLNNRFNQPVWSWMLYEEMLRGRLPVRSHKDFVENLYAYTACEWLPQPFRHIDREKNAKANALERQGGTLLLEDVCGQRGRSWKDTLRKYAKELRFAKKLENEFAVKLPLFTHLGIEDEPTVVDGTQNDGSDDESTTSN